MRKSTSVISSSLENSLEEAKKVGASPDEARVIHDLVSANTDPQFVRMFEVKFGPDSSDKSAVWIYLVVDDDLHPSKEKIAKLNENVNRVRSALLDKNIRFWPYVEVRSHR
jgi:hypothetical protein